jgi:hypothetical protein
MIQCPKCTAMAAPGASDCTKCGYIFTATESNPGFSPQKLFSWWLVFYAFWRLWALATSGIAGFRIENAPAQVFFSGAAALALVSLGAIVLLWRAYKPALFVFIGAEVLSAVWLVLFGQALAAIYPLAAAAIMWVVSKRAWAPAGLTLPSRGTSKG